MHEDYRDRGFEIIAFPSDTFGNEPDKNKVVDSFLLRKYGVDFPIMEKCEVNGKK